MTGRLIALMSLVLALCLATFAFMTRRYHDEVMRELPRTVAEAGQAAIRSLEPARFAVRTAANEPGLHLPLPAPVDLAELREQAVELSRIAEDVVAREALAEGRRIVLERDFGPESAFATAFRDCGDETGDNCLEWRTSGDGETATQIIRIDAIHAQSDPETGVLLRIPTFRTMVVGQRDDGTGGLDSLDVLEIDADTTAFHRDSTDPAAGREIEVHAGTATGSADETSRTVTFHVNHGYRMVVEGEELETRVPEVGDGTSGAMLTAGPSGTPPSVVGRDIVFPIRTDDYKAAYDRFRTKSLLLLAGVFGVGLVLTTGLAARFTRPVRKLDGAVREIADGNLDVTVPVHGRDELARLGTAFNEMARKLREGRDRARELTRREKLSALGRLAAGVAHDVRNPLHSISLTLAHLSESHRPASDGEAADFDRSIEIIREEIGRLDGLVSSFLRFASSGGRERTRVRPSALVEEVARLVRKEAEWRGIELETVLDGSDPEVDADVESLRASVLNLVLNAFEAMPDGGTLRLETHGETGAAVLEVHDSGVGIPEEDRERVFDFGWSTRETGRGLGLAIVHRCIVEDHGGRVRLESEVGRGTTVALHLPAADGDEETGS
jgi:signal transduction histidine kinase